MRKIILFLLLSLLICSVPFPAYAGNGAVKEEDMRAAFENIKKMFDAEKDQSMLYPDDVAGLGYMMDTHHVFVCLKNATAQRKKQIAVQSGFPHMVEFFTAKYSYNALDAVSAEIQALPEDNPLYGFRMTAVGEGPDENYVLVQVAAQRLDSARTYCLKQYGDQVLVEVSGMEIRNFDPPIKDAKPFLGAASATARINVYQTSALTGKALMRIAKSDEFTILGIVGKTFMVESTSAKGKTIQGFVAMRDVEAAFNVAPVPPRSKRRRHIPCKRTANINGSGIVPKALCYLSKELTANI